MLYAIINEDVQIKEFWIIDTKETEEGFEKDLRECLQSVRDEGVTNFSALLASTVKQLQRRGYARRKIFEYHFKDDGFINEFIETGMFPELPEKA